MALLLIAGIGGAADLAGAQQGLARTSLATSRCRGAAIAPEQA
jgi:hypothetical protein